MVAAAARRSAEGLFSFDPFRHLGQVTELIKLAFAEELGPEARTVLRRMRRMARWGGLGLWLWEAEAAATKAPGFVWLEDGRVVGNVSLRRAAFAGGWMVGNVAVHPDWQGQGIGRTLMEAAVEAVQKQSGTWLGLEVREDNDAACGLYERMGFKAVGRMLELARPAGLGWSPPQPPASLLWRPARARDAMRLYALAQEGLEQIHQQVLEVRRSAYRTDWDSRLSSWLDGERQNWWVCEEDGQITGALRLSSHWFARWHRMEVLVRHERLDDLGPQLAQDGLAILSRRPLWETMITLPGPRQILESTLTAAGFRQTRRLVQMRLRLAKPVSSVSY